MKHPIAHGPTVANAAQIAPRQRDLATALQKHDTVIVQCRDFAQSGHVAANQHIGQSANENSDAYTLERESGDIAKAEPEPHHQFNDQ